MEIVENLGQEWCSAKDIDFKGSGFITQFEPNTQQWMILYNKEKYSKHSIGPGNSPTLESSGIRYRPLKFECLNTAEL